PGIAKLLDVPACAGTRDRGMQDLDVIRVVDHRSYGRARVGRSEVEPIRSRVTAGGRTAPGAGHAIEYPIRGRELHAGARKECLPVTIGVLPARIGAVRARAASDRRNSRFANLDGGGPADASCKIECAAVGPISYVILVSPNIGRRAGEGCPGVGPSGAIVGPRSPGANVMAGRL